MAGDDVPRAWTEHRQVPEGGWTTTPAETGGSTAIGQIIRQVRERKALSQHELALRLRDVAANDGQHPQTTRRTISRWERDSRIPQPAYRRWLAAALDLPLETLNRAAAVRNLPDPLTRPQPCSVPCTSGDDPGPDAAVGRLTVTCAAHGAVTAERSVTSGVSASDEDLSSWRFPPSYLAAVIGSSLSLSVLQDLAMVRAQAERLLGQRALAPAALERWDSAVDEHVRSYATRPSAPLLGDLLLDFTDVTAALKDCRSPGTQRHLLHILSRIAGVVAVVVDDLGSTHEARAWMHSARMIARETGDREFQAWTYAREGFFLLHYDRPPEIAVTLARSAIAIAGSRPCASAVMATTVEARAMARLEVDGAAMSALRNASDMLERTPGSAQRGLFGWSLQQLTFSEGRTLTTLGRTQEALAAQDRALTMFSKQEVLDPALVTLDRAQALIRSGDVTEGCRMGTQTLRELTPAYCTPLVASWADDALRAIPHARRDSSEAREFQLSRHGLPGHSTTFTGDPAR
jgi:DNA-binding transcriptional regulator YiaG